MPKALDFPTTAGGSGGGVSRLEQLLDDAQSLESKSKVDMVAVWRG